MSLPNGAIRFPETPDLEVDLAAGALNRIDAPAQPRFPIAQDTPPLLSERAGPFELRLVASPKDLRQTQRLRYNVFYEEGGAIAGPQMARLRLDLCPFDAICDHLIVIDHEAVGRSGRRRSKIVGTYRLLRREVAERHNGFYSQGEFDLAPLLTRHPRARILELGRSCVHPAYRSKRVVELLWRGLWLYATMHKMDALIGCASLPGTDFEAVRLPLSFLLTAARAEPEWDVAPHPLCAESFVPLPPSEVDARRALFALPPLLKAYLRTGAKFASRPVIDRQFGTIDVFTIVRFAEIEDRYIAHYGAPSCVSETSVA